MIGPLTFRLLWGMALSWCLAPREEITSGFFRIQMLVALALSVLGVLTFATEPPAGSRMLMSGGWLSLLAGGIAIVAFIDSVLWTLERRRGAEKGLWLVLGMSALGMVGASPPASLAGHPAAVQRICSAFSSGWLMGAALTAMLLGHWYLTATGMKLIPLMRLNQWVGAAILLRAVLAAVGWGCVGLDRLSPTNWVWLSLRWAGLVGPAVMTLLVIRILKYRNTQSATGVLYASTILVFMGETAALLLARSEEFPWAL